MVGTFAYYGARLAGHAVSLNQSARDLGRDADHLFAQVIDVSAGEIVYGWAGAAIGDELRIEMELRCEQQASHMRRRADPPCACLTFSPFALR